MSRSAGDPVTLVLHEEATLDLAMLDAPRPDELALAPRGDLLEGLDFDESPDFDAWLGLERQRLAADCRALTLRWSVELLARGEPDRAVAFARRAVELDSLNADAHTVLVSALARSGAHDAAQEQVARARDLFRRGLGVEPPASVSAATVVPTDEPALGSAVSRSLLEVADSALSAGAAAIGIGQLRRALAAVPRRDTALGARARLRLASARIHHQGGRGVEVVTLLHEALNAAERTGEASVAAAAGRELGFLAVQNGHRAEAEHWLGIAEEHRPDRLERSRIWGVRGMSLNDEGRYGDALEIFERARAICPPENPRQAAWCAALAGRTLVLQGDMAQARHVLEQALAEMYAEHWTTVQPLPEAMLAEAALTLGDVERARNLLEHAWVTAAEADDQCWIAVVAHGRARLASVTGSDAMAWCDRGLSAAPWYLFFRGWLLDLAAELVDEPTQALAYAGELERLAASGGMHDLARRALAHRGRWSRA